MTRTLLDVAGDALLLAGLLFILAGAVGVLRLPDFYTRLHALGSCDTLGVGLMVVGLAVQQETPQLVLKMLLVLVFVGLANPTAIHALGRAAQKSGLDPWRRPEREGGGA
ncbi:MAG TPA: monovalent cation/H(+) antiporter subunit G [Thermoanaerobaculia bacterium]|nr:monovalent cation/H(+) antiporter subunit G [Thermoanaerobaculia bacterium]